MTTAGAIAFQRQSATQHVGLNRDMPALDLYLADPGTADPGFQVTFVIRHFNDHLETVNER